MSGYFELYDFRIRVAEMYRERNQALLGGADPMATAQRFREQRDNLFRYHPQSALDEKQKQVFDSYMNELKKSYKVEINKDALAKMWKDIKDKTGGANEKSGQPAPKPEGAK